MVDQQKQALLHPNSTPLAKTSAELEEQRTIRMQHSRFLVIVTSNRKTPSSLKKSLEGSTYPR